MNLNLFIILASIAIVTTIVLYISAKNAEKVKEEETPKFQPRQVTVIGKEVYKDETPIEAVKPKRKYKKRKSKKPAVEEVKSTKKPKISK